jgi:hypothetical protein
LREQIERLRGRPSELSPEGLRQAAGKPQPVAAPAALDATWKVVAICCVLLAVIGWVVLWKLLDSYSGNAIREMLAP